MCIARECTSFKFAKYWLNTTAKLTAITYLPCFSKKKPWTLEIFHNNLAITVHSLILFLAGRIGTGAAVAVDRHPHYLTTLSLLPRTLPTRDLSTNRKVVRATYVWHSAPVPRSKGQRSMSPGCLTPWPKISRIFEREGLQVTTCGGGGIPAAHSLSTLNQYWWS